MAAHPVHRGGARQPLRSEPDCDRSLPLASRKGSVLSGRPAIIEERSTPKVAQEPKEGPCDAAGPVPSPMSVGLEDPSPADEEQMHKSGKEAERPQPVPRPDNLLEDDVAQMPEKQAAQQVSDQQQQQQSDRHRKNSTMSKRSDRCGLRKKARAFVTPQGRNKHGVQACLRGRPFQVFAV